jgi:hypothetical protein
MHTAQTPTRARLNDSGDLDAVTLLRMTVDRLAIIKRDISELQEEETALKNILAESGSDVIEGSMHRASVSITTRTLVDWQAVAQHFEPSRQLLTAHTTTGAPYATIRLTAKKTH